MWWRRVLLAWLLLPFLAGGTWASNYQTVDFDWYDMARDRPVPVRLYWPQAEEPVPLVVVSHGIGGSRQGYRYLGEYFASHGMASLHLQHVGSDRGLWRGNPFTIMGRLGEATSDREAVARVGDLSFALDRILAHERFGPHIDRARIAGAGHSYGANTVMLASGARVLRNGRLIDLRDARLRGAVLLSAPPFYGEANQKSILGALRLPTLHVTTTEDVIRIPGFYSPASDRLLLFNDTGSPLKALAVFDGGSHSIFTNRRADGGEAFDPKVKQATRELALAFLRRVFYGAGEALERWPRVYAPLLARWVSPSPVW